ncbi:rRNA (guanine-N1)-methyltransferase [Aliidiomarina minuta]|uniref:rRNA (Guanine-N1)-methyltransferase n=2 Tax=Aliidiomarina minuta TaxID=880057 RepID=A0A432WAP8_9GAMM|nr:rRNA (guanine-N1)-methyltransferase [Aliidiomarina minuta]
MVNAGFTRLACPIDGKPLQLQDKSWRCPDNHCFDQARQGYVHLLPVQQKRSRDPGDSKEMIAARRRFLNSGFYQPVADTLAKAVLTSPHHELACLDAGCGEGYYLRVLSSLNTTKSIQMLGLDISKAAIISAAKQDKGPSWVVGSNARLPVQNESVDCLFSVFGFPVYAEFARVLKPGGHLYMLDPGPEHLRQLREIIYPQVKSQCVEEKTDPPGFATQSIETISYMIRLTDGQQIADLLLMTPHLFRASAAGRALAAELQHIEVQVEVRLRTLQRL